MENLIDRIVKTIQNKYNGKLDCKEQQADLFVYVNGEEEVIESIDTESIHFRSSMMSIKFIDADIHSLAYINEVIN